MDGPEHLREREQGPRVLRQPLPQLESVAFDPILQADGYGEPAMGHGRGRERCCAGRWWDGARFA